VESVLAFVEDKEAAIHELIRMTKPGGYVGLNETYWTELPSPELLSYSLEIGPQIITEAEWRAIWEAMPLEARTIQTLALEAKQELRDRIKWIGWRSILPAWGRVIKLLLTNRRSRDAIKQQLDTPTELAKFLGYALFVGRKPLPPADRSSDYSPGCHAEF